MKKLILIFAVLGLTLFSCSSNEEPQYVNAKMETAYVIPLKALLEEDYSARKVHRVVPGDNLSDLAQYYLGNSQLWGDLLVENPYLASEASSRGFQRPNGPGWFIWPGEIIFLPNYALDRSNSIWFDTNRKVTFDLGTERLEQFIRQVPLEKDPSKLFVRHADGGPGAVIAEQISSQAFWLDNYPLLRDFLGLLFALVMIVLAAVIIHRLLHWTFNNPPVRRDITSQQSETESRTGESTTIQSSFNETHHHYYGDRVSEDVSVAQLKQFKNIVKHAKKNNISVSFKNDTMSFDIDSDENEFEDN